MKTAKTAILLAMTVPLLAGAVRFETGGVVQLSLPASAIAIDPTAIGTTAEGMLAGLIFDGLYAWEPAAEAPSIGMRETQALLTPNAPPAPPSAGPRLVPRLAASDPIAAPDGRTFRIPVRAGVRSHDGRPLRAPEIAASLARTLRSSSTRWVLGDLEGAPAYTRARAPRGLPAGIVVTSETELSLRFATPPGDVRRLLAAPALAIVAPATRPDRPVGTGAFRADDVGAGGVTLRANASHFAGPPFLERIVALPPRARNDEVRAFEVGELWMSFHAASVYGGQPRGGSRRLTGPAVQVVALLPRADSALLRDVEARRALAKAIDRGRLSRLSVEPPPLLPARTMGRDVPGARAALLRAVARMGPAGVARVGSRPRVTLAHDAADAIAASIAEVVVASLDEIGLDVSLVPRGAADADLRLVISTPSAPDAAGLVATLLAASGGGAEAAALLGRGDARAAGRAAVELNERGTGLWLGLRTPVLHARAALSGLRFDPLGRLDLGSAWVP